MIFKVYIADCSGPTSGLTPSWDHLYSTDGTDKSGDAPTISEIGGGWYKFELTYGQTPWNVAELVGVIDAGDEVLDAQRHVPICVSLRDLGFAFLTNTRRQTIATGLIEILEDDGSTVLMRLTPSESDGQEVLTPSGGG
jgi:hypothetical protein